ncbi:hypothetical protein AB4156_42935, partial [Cupriavidus sp. 2MCAB6]
MTSTADTLSDFLAQVRTLGILRALRIRRHRVHGTRHNTKACAKEEQNRRMRGLSLHGFSLSALSQLALTQITLSIR